ncbi:MAG: S-layer homology domain-containing protein [Tissierellia bacterium]|nr:S-layer homology domain-containing protein [Tissierellia bacterium]MDD3226266.1 S-layer homology domain-containing protein [Tissierellia bacterium]MDD4046000.1 S-layer homology domain-containing protein [Tissierellia bacterium]MDD4678436.1 S-layer homology domain-containing protein [Tissierellia bacterium]
MKKTLLIIIILIFVASFANVYAAGFLDVKKDPFLEEAIGVLSGYEVIQGYPDSSFKPDRIVTRAEMAKVVTVAAGFHEYSKNMTSVYEDMHGHWAESYVELADVLGIVKGISPSAYYPDNLIKFEEAYTMILRLLGYTDESLIGSWPSNYHEKAIELNLFENINSNVEFASRRDITIMLFNALSMNLVTVKENNTLNITNKALISKLGKMETKEVSIKDLNIDNFDYTDYLFNKWDIYYDNHGNTVFVNNPRYNEFSGTVTSLLSNRVIFVTDDFGNVRVFQVPDIPIIINGERGSFNNLNESNIKIVYDEDSFNGEVIGIIAYKATDVIVVERDDLYKEGSRQFAGKNLPLKNSEVNHKKLHIKGDAESLDEIKLNDVVYFYEMQDDKNNSLTLYVLRSQIEGVISSVDSVNGAAFYTLNNISYMTGKDYFFTEKANIDDSVTLILDKNNNIIKLYINKYGKMPSTYGIVISSSNSTGGSASARILDEYGRLRTYSLADNSSAVRVHEDDSSILKQSLIGSNDFVMFDPVLNETLKIINLMQTRSIASSYNNQTQTLENGGYRISSDTFIVYKSDGQYQLLVPSQLDEYLEGKAVVNYLGHIDAIYLTKGLKSTAVTVTPDIQQNYNGTIYGIIKGVTKLDDTTSHLQFFNDSNVFSVINTTVAGKSMMNSYVRAVIVNGMVSSIEKVTPETSRIKISQIYTNQILIDDITYMEYSQDVKVYVCTLDSSGNISGFKEGTKSDIKAGSTAQLYDLYGGFDGVIDVVLIFK